ncbi:hypothetical protein M378DRAFT_165429 [Amanita muscaria Koide BX008]|uniref:Uncharacterized protein n=1 Tax=Amanita muscaria (strain Koide BX008) TaxID=946122 RepID=A0A0C2T7Z7_AMAMK|nr:hypothetical protein M378DRAFT_165429 [Amanita muscaria Koide BX008]
MHNCRTSLGSDMMISRKYNTLGPPRNTSSATRGYSFFPAPVGTVMPVIEKSSNFTVGGNARLYEIHGDGVIHQGPDADELKRAGFSQ